MAEVDSGAETVTGQLGGLMEEPLEVHGEWPGGYQEVTTDDSGHFTAVYPDVPRGARGYVRYMTTANYAEVIIHRDFRNPDLLLQVNETDDWIEGNYEVGRTLLITVTDSGGTVKGMAELQTGEVPWWNGNTGFSTNWQEWQGERPDIRPGDRVYATMDNGYTSTVHVGAITGSVDADADSIEGTVDAEGIAQQVTVSCESWGDYGAPDPRNKYDLIWPNGSDPYHCTWDPASEWDVLPAQRVGVRYTEPDGDQVITIFEEPTPHVWVDKWVDGDSRPAEGGALGFWGGGGQQW